MTCILQDSTGFLWFGTQDGLNRFDGHRFQIHKHDPQDPATLPHDAVRALAEDEGGDLWVGTDGGGLARWDRTSHAFTSYPHSSGAPNALSGPRVRSMVRDSSGVLWIATIDSGLSRFDPSTGRFRHYRHDPEDPRSLADDKIRAMIVDRAGDLWIGTMDGLSRFARDTAQAVSYRASAGATALRDSRVLSLYEDSHNRLWVGTFGGLHLFDRRAETFTAYVHDPADTTSLSENRVQAILEDQEGRLWIGTDGGLNLLDPASGKMTHYSPNLGDPHSLSSQRILSIYQDHGGVLWVGTLNGGVNSWNPLTWSFSHNKISTVDPSSNDIYALTEDEDGRLWIGSLGGLHRFDRSTGEIVKLTHRPGNPGSLSDDRVMALLIDRGGVLWVGTVAGGLNRLDPGSAVFKRYRHAPEDGASLSRNGVRTLFEDRAGRLWIGTQGGGLNLFDRRTETFRHYRHDPDRSTSLSNDRVSAIVESADGALWIGTSGGGLNYFDPETERFLHFVRDPELPYGTSNDTINALHLDAHGVLWIGTQGGGLNQLEGFDRQSGQARFKNYSERDGLPNDVIYGIESDGENRLWLSTNNGLCRLNPRTAEIESYNASHGLQNVEFNLGAHHRSSRGELFFGGVNGFNAFFPQRIRQNQFVPPVVLTSFTKLNEDVAFGVPISEVEEISLTYRDYFFSLEFAALDYTWPEKNRYMYKLEGFDRDWVDSGALRRATYTNLKPADYTFRFKGSNNDGVWNEEGNSIMISIAPPPWKTWWAYLLYALILIAGVVPVYRIQRLRAATTELEARALKVENERKEQELVKARELARAYQALEQKNQEILRAQTQLVQSEKMASLGQLVAGVAHEINNPVNFISSGLPSLRRDVAKLAGYALAEKNDPRLEKTRERLGKLVDAIEEGSRRTAEIVKNLRTFSRLDEAAIKTADIHQALDATLSLLQHQTKERIRVVRNYGGIPAIECYVSQLNQVFMNVLVNAVQAIDGEGTITITTSRIEDEHVQIAIRDTGRGVTEEVQKKVFDPFFTTKPVGQGTGLGLSISHGIIEKHGGTITVESEQGRGTEFVLVLPLRLSLPEFEESARSSQ